MPEATATQEALKGKGTEKARGSGGGLGLVGWVQAQTQNLTAKFKDSVREFSRESRTDHSN